VTKKPSITADRSPEDILPILRLLSEANCVIIGGQAVNIWSSILGDKRVSPWKEHFPFTSMDGDALANRKQMEEFTVSLAREGYDVKMVVPPEGEKGNINTGFVEADSPKFAVGVNLINKAVGLKSEEIVATAQTATFCDTKVLLLHPLLCVEGKAAALTELEQNKPGERRRDKKHLQLAVANMRVFLQGLLQSDSKGALLLANRLVGCATSRLGKTVKNDHAIDLLDAIPWGAFQSSEDTKLKELGYARAEIESDEAKADAAEQDLKSFIADIHKKDAERKSRDSVPSLSSEMLHKEGTPLDDVSTDKSLEPVKEKVDGNMKHLARGKSRKKRDPDIL